jgi:hypothetical protein
VTIAPPGRAASAETLPAVNDDISTFARHFPRLPGAPLGTYRISARQGTVTAEREFVVRRASDPRLWLDRPVNAPAGVDVHLYLGGFPPGRTTSLDLYGTEPPRYLTSFPVRVDADGEAHAVIDTKPDDPTGCYGVSHPLLYDPGVPSDAVFCLF